MRPARSALLLVASSLMAAVAACSGNPEIAISDQGGRSGASNTGAAGDHSAPGEGGAGFDLGLSGNANDAGSTVKVPQLLVSAEQETLEVSGSPATVQLSARYDDGSKPNRVVWSVDDTALGSVSADGEFRASGFVAGDVTITASVGSQTASITLHVSVAIKSDPDELDASLADDLVSGGQDGPSGIGPDADFRFLYPYDKTVFPRGLAAPLLQLGGEDADATYVKISVGDFSYEAFATASGLTRVALPAEVWRGITLSAAPGEWVEVAVSKTTGGEVTGPVVQRWQIAPGSLKGFVYYNTYRSKLAGDNGAVMRIKPGETATVLQSGCTVCHSVSAQGNVMVAGVQWDQSNPLASRAFDLPANGGIQLRNQQDEGRVYAFGGLTPDGALMLTSGVPKSGAKMRGMSGELATRLVDT